MRKCKLTGLEGDFVKSHLLPRALTRLSRTGEKTTELGPGRQRPIRRTEGWYDTQLVISNGEKILERYDTHGIAELRRLGLVWSSAYNSNLVRVDFESEKGQRFVHIRSEHPKRLRMFVLSLLWRAASTKIEAFSHFSISESDREYLRSLLLSDGTGLESEFHTVFVATCGPGAVHNHTPIRQELEIEEGVKVDYSRFYLDGLIVHVCDRNCSRSYAANAQTALVGFNREFDVVVVPFFDSRQKSDLVDVMTSAGMIY